ncbi:MAG TPA: hypothetical protein VE093_27780 [Polyangiaceae bacterium]|nr:hypothetical protein [Polyangiaceae bacterium]
MRRLLSIAALGLVLPACAAMPPSKWAEGGARLELPRARWALVELAVDLLPDGTIWVNSEHVLTLDSAGRVINPDKEPVAMLMPDGRLLGKDDEPLGVVGSLHASMPDEANAWLSVLPTGEVIRYIDDGERMNFGAWLGCNVSPRAQQSCTLVTHLLGMRIKEEQDRLRASNGGYRPGMMPGMVPFGLGGW